jgi:hypothetical protein
MPVEYPDTFVDQQCEQMLTWMWDLSRGRTARMTDCQIKAVRASLVEM